MLFYIIFFGSGSHPPHLVILGMQQSMHNLLQYSLVWIVVELIPGWKQFEKKKDFSSFFAIFDAFSKWNKLSCFGELKIHQLLFIMAKKWRSTNFRVIMYLKFDLVLATNKNNMLCTIHNINIQPNIGHRA